MFLVNKAVSMDTIENDVVVEIIFTMKNNKGETVGKSTKAQPLSFIQGKQNIISGIEKAVAGKRVGDIFQTKISPKDGYGEYNKNLVQVVSKKEFGMDTTSIKVGMQYQAQAQDNQMVIVTVTNIEGDNIELNGNDPLAGEVLDIDIEILTIRKATKKELEKGHLKVAKSSCSCC